MTSGRREERFLKSLDDKLETDQLLKLFTVFPMEEDLLYEELLEHKKILEGLKYRATITQEQLNLLLPISKLTDFTTFDYSLLHVLIYKFTDLEKALTGWDEEPLPKDQSESACYIRIFIARKAISKIKQPVSYTAYQGILNYVRQPLLDLGHEKSSMSSLFITQRFNVIAQHLHFVGRKDEVAEIESCFFRNETSPCRSIVVLHGPDGHGKRELTRMYIRTKGYKHDDNVLWLNASTDNTLKRSIHDLCVLLGLSTTNQHGTYLDESTMMRNVQYYLENTKVLFVFENVKCYQQVMDLLPSNDLTSTIIISKEKFCVRRFHHVAVGKFSATQADDYLKRALPIGNSYNTPELRKHLMKVLWFNPLALSLAVSFIHQSGTYTWDYICAAKIVISENIPKQIQDDPTLRPIFTAFYLTCNALCENELAFYILNLLSYLNGSYIQQVFIENILRNANKFTDTQAIDEAFDLLLNLSLVNCRLPHDKTNITIHSSIQEANRIYHLEFINSKSTSFHSIMDYMFKYSGYHRQRHYLCGEDWIDHLIYIFETKAFHSHVLLKCKQNQQFLFDTFSSKGRCQDLLSIFMKLENVSDKKGKDRFNIKINIAKCYQHLGNMDKALLEFEDIEYRLTRYYGNDDPQVIETKFLRSFLIYKQKRFAAALDLCNDILSQMTRLEFKNDQLRLGLEYLLIKCNKKCGTANSTLQDVETFKNEKLKIFQEYHPYVFRVQYDIGKYHQKNGDYVDAIQHYKVLEREQNEVYGDCHADTLKTKKQLANCYMKLGECHKVLSILNHIKSAQTATHGSEHPITLKTELDYVLCLQLSGKYDEAFDILCRIETIQQNHLMMFTTDELIQTKYNIGDCLQLLGFYHEAFLKYQEIRRIQEDSYGSDHPDVLKTKHYLAFCLHDMGHMDQASHLYKEIEQAQSNVLGDHHEDVLRTQHNLSVCFIDSYQEKKAFKELKDLEEKQKAQHQTQLYQPEILITQTNMALCLHKRQYYERALKKYQEILNIQKQYFDETHHVILMLKHYIAICLHDQGKYNEALEKYRNVYTTQCMAYGADHPDTLRTRYNKAICHFDTRKFRKAFQELEAVEELQMEVLGESHPDTKRTQTSLNICGRDYHAIIGGSGSMCTIM